MFDEQFPQYLAMGMTSEQFWDQDCGLVVPFRKAYRLKQEKENYLAWLQGMYIYDAFSSVIGQAFAKRGQHVEPYPNKPYDLGIKKKTKAEKQEEKKQNTISFMEKLAAKFNQQFAERNKQQPKVGEGSDQA